MAAPAIALSVHGKVASDGRRPGLGGCDRSQFSILRHHHHQPSMKTPSPLRPPRPRARPGGPFTQHLIIPLPFISVISSLGPPFRSFCCQYFRALFSSKTLSFPLDPSSPPPEQVPSGKKNADKYTQPTPLQRSRNPDVFVLHCLENLSRPLRIAHQQHLDHHREGIRGPSHLQT